MAYWVPWLDLRLLLSNINKSPFGVNIIVKYTWKSTRLHRSSSTFKVAMANVTRVLMGVKFLLMVTTLMVTMVKAVDIQSFSDSSACSGTGYTFAGIGQRTCAVTNAGSFLIRDLASCHTARVFRNGGCNTIVGSGNGPNVRCFVGGGYTGADWHNNCGKEVHKGCNNIAVPDGVHYTENVATGSWVLKTPYASKVLAELMAIDNDLKVDWLKAHGAHYVPGNENYAIV